MKMRDLIREHSVDLTGLSVQQATDLRQALADQGMPEMLARRVGPGSGPDATPASVALLVLAAWSGSTYANARSAAFALHMTGIADGRGDGPVATIVTDDDDGEAPQTCPITGALTFGAAITRLLSDPPLAAGILRVEVQHGTRAATIIGLDGMVSRFAEGSVLATRGGVWTVTNCNGAALANAAVTLAEESI